MPAVSVTLTNSVPLAVSVLLILQVFWPTVAVAAAQLLPPNQHLRLRLFPRQPG